MLVALLEGGRALAGGVRPPNPILLTLPRFSFISPPRRPFPSPPPTHPCGTGRCTRQPALFAEFHKILDARPAKTLTHGDMRGDNMFKKKDGSGFVVIDWQTFGAATPGVEMHQVCGISIQH